MRIPAVTAHFESRLDAALLLARTLQMFAAFRITRRTGTAVAYKNQIQHDFNKYSAAAIAQIGFVLWRYNLPFMHILFRSLRFFCRQIDAIRQSDDPNPPDIANVVNQPIR